MERRRIIEGTWRCRSCDQADIEGRHKVCPSCGNPREDEETRFTFGADAATVKADELLDLASAGRDWFCAQCSASNRGDATVCRQCGAERGAPAVVAPPPARRLAAPARLPSARIAVVLLALGVPPALCCGGLGVGAWRGRPLVVDAAVVERSWVRQVRVQRLSMAVDAGWEDELPPAAGVPGSGALAPGRGAMLGCETRACWPRPPAGATLARVTGRSWRHEISTRRLVEQPREGWDDQVPAGLGALPVHGEGGREGRIGAASCRGKEREPERCHVETRREACGTREECTRRDLGNGFAEEVCRDVTKWCERRERECTPPVRDDWCTWRTLSWSAGRTASRTGSLDAPSWPPLVPTSNEAVTRSASYTTALETLAGPPVRSFAPSSPAELLAHDPGQLLFVRGDRVEPVPPELVPADAHRVDCGDGVPVGVLATRRWCRFEGWTWHDEPPLEAVARRTARRRWPRGPVRVGRAGARVDARGGAGQPRGAGRRGALGRMAGGARPAGSGGPRRPVPRVPGRRAALTRAKGAVARPRVLTSPTPRSRRGAPRGGTAPPATATSRRDSSPSRTHFTRSRGGRKSGSTTTHTASGGTVSPYTSETAAATRFPK